MKGDVYFKHAARKLSIYFLILILFPLIFPEIYEHPSSFLHTYLVWLSILFIVFLWEDYDRRKFIMIDVNNKIYFQGLFKPLFFSTMNYNRYLLAGDLVSVKLFMKIDLENIKKIEVVKNSPLYFKRRGLKDPEFCKYLYVKKSSDKVVRIIFKKSLLDDRLKMSPLTELYFTLEEPEKFIKTIKQRMNKS